MGDSGLFWKCEASLKGPIKSVPGRAGSEKSVALPPPAVLAGSPCSDLFSGSAVAPAPALTHGLSSSAEEMQAYAKRYLKGRSGLKQSSQFPFTADKPYLGEITFVSSGASGVITAFFLGR